MKCPVDNETLVMADRNGVEIDYCPKCRGVWLDRGELDKIIERAGVGAAAPVAAPAQAAAPQAPRQAAPYPAPPQSAPPPHYRRDDDDDHYRYGPGHSSDYYKKKKRKDFLSDLFDF